MPVLSLVFEAGDELVTTSTCLPSVYPLGLHFAAEQTRWLTGKEPVLVNGAISERTLDAR